MISNHYYLNNENPWPLLFRLLPERERQTGIHRGTAVQREREKETERERERGREGERERLILPHTVGAKVRLRSMWSLLPRPNMGHVPSY